MIEITPEGKEYLELQELVEEGAKQKPKKTEPQTKFIIESDSQNKMAWIPKELLSHKSSNKIDLSESPTEPLDSSE